MVSFEKDRRTGHLSCQETSQNSTLAIYAQFVELLVNFFNARWQHFYNAALNNNPASMLPFKIRLLCKQIPALPSFFAAILLYSFRNITHWSTIEFFLEQRQYKNDSIQSKIVSILKLFFSPRHICGEKPGNFKIGIIFDWMESFLHCLCSSGVIKKFFTG